MKLSLPFTYTVTHQKPGNHKATTSVALSMVKADIPSVRRSDADVVAEWNVPSNDRSAKKTVISWNGGLFRKLGISSELLAGVNPSALARFSRDDALKRLYGMQHWGGNRSKQLLKALSGEDTPREIPKSRIVTATTLEHDRAEAQYMIEGLLDVEGDTWHRIPGMLLYLFQFPGQEPGLSISPAPYGQEKVELLSGMAGIQNPVLTQYFDVNERSRALSHVDDDSRVQWHFHDLKIHRPDLIAYDGQAEFTARIMNSAVRTNDYRVGEMGEREIALWMRMREAVARWYGLPPEPLAEDDVDALYEFCAMTPKSHMNEWPRRGCEILDVYRADLEGPTMAKVPSPRR